MYFLKTDGQISDKSLHRKELSEADYEYTKKIIEHKDIKVLIDKNYIVPSWIELHPGSEKSFALFFLVQEKPDIVTYPFEWSFCMLKDAALSYLKLVKECIALNFMVSTGKANSICYLNGKMQFHAITEISDSSLDNLWPGYQQFLETFLFPLLFNANFGVDFSIVWKGTLRGLSFAEATKLLKNYNLFNDLRMKLNLPVEDDYKSEITLRNQRDIADIVNYLIDFVGKIEQKYSKQAEHWIAYQKDNDYSNIDIKVKEKFIINGIKKVEAKRIIDLGANTGHYSKVVQDYVSHVTAVECESACVDDLYTYLRKSQNSKITPVLLNLHNPSADLGYNLSEYLNFFDRSNADFFLALAVMHHITVPTHISLENFVRSLKRIAPSGIIEWISPDEEMSRKELSKDKHRNKNYTWSHFVDLLHENFEVIEVLQLHSEYRTLCLLDSKK